MIILNPGQNFIYHNNNGKITVSFVCMHGDIFLFKDSYGKEYSFTRFDFYDKVLTPYSRATVESSKPEHLNSSEGEISFKTEITKKTNNEKIPKPANDLSPKTKLARQTIEAAKKESYSVKRFERADRYEKNVSGKPAYKTHDDVQFNGIFNATDKVVEKVKKKTEETRTVQKQGTKPAEYDSKYLKSSERHRISDILYKRISRTGKGEISIDIRELDFKERDEVINFALKYGSKNLKTLRIRHGVKWAYADAYGKDGETTGKIIDQRTSSDAVGVMVYTLDQGKEYKPVEVDIVRDDLSLICQECGKEFVFTVGEQEYFAERDYKTPRRCKKCRKKPRNNKPEDISFIAKELGYKTSSFFENYSGSERPVGGGLSAEFEHFDTVQKENYEARKRAKRKRR